MRLAGGAGADGCLVGIGGVFIVCELIVLGRGGTLVDQISQFLFVRGGAVPHPLDEMGQQAVGFADRGIGSFES